MQTKQFQHLALALVVLAGTCHARARDPRDVELKVDAPQASPLAQLLRSSPSEQALSYPAALSGSAGMGLRVVGKYRFRDNDDEPHTASSRYHDVTHKSETNDAPSYIVPDASIYQSPHVSYGASQEDPSYQETSQEASNYPVPSHSLQEYSVGPGLPAAQGFHLGGHTEGQDHVQGRYQVHNTEPEHEVEEKGHGKDAKYDFVYRVKDHDYKPLVSGHGHGGEGSDFGHSEARNGDRTWGRYFVKLPDGRVQTVRYWADHTGYHAEVQFQGKASHPEPSKHHHNPGNHLGSHVKSLGPTYAALQRDNSEENIEESSGGR